MGQINWGYVPTWVAVGVAAIGGAVAAGAKNLVASRLGPADPSILSDAGWRQALRDSAKQAGFRGGMTLGTDLMQIPVAKR